MNKRININFSLVLMVFSFGISSCATKQEIDINNYIGLYEVVNSECHVDSKKDNSCDSALFFELVKGQFIGVGDSDLAYVFWSGEPKVDPELQYASFLIFPQFSLKYEGNKFWLNNGSESEEYLHFSNGKITEYYAKYKVGNTGAVKTIQYTLKPVERGNLPYVRLNYPGNK